MLRNAWGAADSGAGRAPIVRAGTATGRTEARRVDGVVAVDADAERQAGSQDVACIGEGCLCRARVRNRHQVFTDVKAFVARTRFQQLSNTADGFALHQCADHCPGRLIDPQQSHNHRVALNWSI